MPAETRPPAGRGTPNSSSRASSRTWGIDNILRSTNFTLATSIWPRTGEVIDRCFRGVSQGDREKVLWKTAAGLYRL